MEEPLLYIGCLSLNNFSKERVVLTVQVGIISLNDFSEKRLVLAV